LVFPRSSRPAESAPVQGNMDGRGDSRPAGLSYKAKSLLHVSEIYGIQVSSLKDAPSPLGSRAQSRDWRRMNILKSCMAAMAVEAT
jgi:hypothetical protein